MRTSGSKTAALAAAAAGLLMSAAAANAVSLTVGTASGDPGSVEGVGVTLQSMGSSVAGTQNDLTFPTAGTGLIAVETKAPAHTKPDCTVNPDIGKEGTAFSYQPPACTPGTTCTGVRALVLSLSNVDPIPDGSTLYTCQFAVPSDAGPGNYELNISNVGASDPNGVALDATGVAGSFQVTGTVHHDVTLAVGTANDVAPGSSTSVGVTLSTGLQVAGTQNDITFTADAAISAKQPANTKPDCAVNPDIGKEGTAFSYQPPACTVGTTCTAVRALVLSLSNVDPIPDGSTLYTCNVAVSSTATPDTSYPLTCSNAGSSDPNGVALDTGCTDGAVVTSAGAPTPTSSPTVTLTPAVTNTPSATNTVTRTSTSTPKPTSAGGNNDDDGCAVTAPAQSHAGWLLLLPAAMLLWVRRRSR